MRIILETVIVTCLLILSKQVIYGITYNVPQNASVREGNASTRMPFNTIGGFRYQQVYDGSQFLPIQNLGGGYITMMEFRVDTFAYPNIFAATYPSIQVNLSLTQISAENMSLVYSENVGVRDTMVLGPAELVMVGSSSDGDRPEPFGAARLNFTTPFFYDPADGNLLLDIRIFEGGFTTDWDAIDVPDDGLARVWGDFGETASGSDSLGLVTQFEIEPIPEPGIMALLALGLTGIGFYFRKKRRTT